LVSWRPSRTPCCSSIVVTPTLLTCCSTSTISSSPPQAKSFSSVSLQPSMGLHNEGPRPHHFLAILVEQRYNDLFLHQRQYTRDILELTSMSDCKPCTTSIDTQAKVSFDMGAPVGSTWLGLSSTSPSPGLTSPSRSSRCASTCPTILSLISRL
jgi:uncharacterized protein YjiS (DUF1127 family)